jgi:hypothetical protein
VLFLDSEAHGLALR